MVFIGMVTAIVNAVTLVFWFNTDFIVTLKLCSWTVPTAWESWWTVLFIAHISTIFVSITAEVRGYTVTTVALERSILALEFTTADFI